MIYKFNLSSYLFFRLIKKVQSLVLVLDRIQVNPPGSSMGATESSSIPQTAVGGTSATFRIFSGPDGRGNIGALVLHMLAPCADSATFNQDKTTWLSTLVSVDVLSERVDPGVTVARRSRFDGGGGGGGAEMQLSMGEAMAMDWVVNDRDMTSDANIGVLRSLIDLANASAADVAAAARGGGGGGGAAAAAAAAPTTAAAVAVAAAEPCSWKAVAARVGILNNLTVSWQWHDQGWGNQKGTMKLRLLHSTTGSVWEGAIGHGARASKGSWKRASSCWKDMTWTMPSDHPLRALAMSGMAFELTAMAGSGGGHALVVKDAFIDVNNGAIRNATPFSHSMTSRSSSRGCIWNRVGPAEPGGTLVLG